MSLPGGIRTTLALALLLIVGGALAGAYVMVVPSLERRLVDERLDELGRDAQSTAYAYTKADARGEFGTPLAVDAFADGASLLANARVAIFQVFGPEPLSLRPLADSAAQAGSISEDAVALDTARHIRTARGRVDRNGRPFAEVAVPLVSGNVLLLSTPIEPELATVRVVKRRLLYATGVALAIAAILGSAAATLHARRIRRLERAANRIAKGRFDEPVVDLGDDELGELAAAFERMRVQLAQLDTARKEFVANASHELRTPLFSLAGFLELMADEDLDEETRAGFLATTREQVDRLTKLAADLLDLSRIDAGRLRVEQEDVVLADTARTLLDELTPLAESTGHRLVLENDAEAWALADEERVEQEDVVLADTARTLVDELTPLAESTGHRLVLESDAEAWALADEERVLQIGRALAGNALTHTPAGTEIRISTAHGDGHAELSVSDDGPGIPHEHAERVFDRFYRVEGPHASGSGLGLAIARELAERMGGTVDLRSAGGRTTFTLSLPATTAPVEELAVST